jgi:hypothetical protein
MVDAGGRKDGDAGTVKNQVLNHVRYKRDLKVEQYKNGEIRFYIHRDSKIGIFAKPAPWI